MTQPPSEEPGREGSRPDDANAAGHPPPSYEPFPYPQGPHPEYGQPMYGGPYYTPAQGRTNGFAVASLVFGILAFFCVFIGSVLALVFGYIALRQIRERNEEGRGLAIAGIVLGWVGVAIFVAFILLFAIASSSSTSFE